MVSCGWARPGTRKKSEQFSRSFARRAPEYISLSTGAREPSAPSSDQRGEVGGLFFLSRIEIHVTPITVLALQITEWKPCLFEAVRLQFAFVGVKWAETEFGCGIRPAVDPWTKPQPGSGAFFSDLAVTHFSGHLLRYHLDSLRNRLTRQTRRKFPHALVPNRREFM